MTIAVVVVIIIWLTKLIVIILYSDMLRAHLQRQGDLYQKMKTCYATTCTAHVHAQHMYIRILCACFMQAHTRADMCAVCACSFGFYSREGFYAVAKYEVERAKGS